MQKLSVMMAGLWWASLCTVGFLVVPMLFVHLATPAMAGSMAAKLFSAQTWLSVVCGLYLLMSVAARSRRASDQPGSQPQANELFWILAALIAALLVEFAVAPKIVARDNLGFWHRVGSVLYLTQCVCTAFVFWKSLTQLSQTPP